MPYTPTDFFKDGETQTAETVSEYYQLLWEGWTAGGPHPEPVRGPTSVAHLEDLYMSDATSAIAVALREGGVAPLGKQAGVDDTGVIECSAAINTALTGFAALGITATATGSYKIGNKVTVNSDADLGASTFLYTSTGTAVQLGTSTSGVVCNRLRIIAPRVIATAKTTTGWGQVAGSVGIDATNLQGCEYIGIPYVQNFETGFRTYGKGQGNVHNNYFLGHLDNNKVNQFLSADATGWNNQNVFMGGRFSHNSAEGTAVSGVRHIEMAVTTNVVNNNLWLNPSVEGIVEDFNVIFAGNYNIVDNGRWEAVGGARVKWQSTAVGNWVRGGYAAEAIIETIVPGASRNRITHINGDRFSFSGTAPLVSGKLGGLVLENVTSSSNSSITIMEAGARAAGTNEGTGYAVTITADKLRGKRSTNAFDRIWLDFVNSRFYFGIGTSAPTQYVGFVSSGQLGLVGSGWDPGTHNTHDLGFHHATTPFKWRYIRSSVGVQVGGFATGSRPPAATAAPFTMIFDTTLGKPIWVNAAGTGWVDATGATV